MNTSFSLEKCKRTRWAQIKLLWKENELVEVNFSLYGLIIAGMIYCLLYSNKINARVLIGQSAMVYCAGKPMEKSRVFWIII